MIIDLLLKIVSLLHILFVIFVVVAPFAGSNYFLMLHAVFIPFIIIHWIFNDNTCVLTIIERNLKRKLYGKIDEDECITCKLIEPVYDFKKNYAKFSAIIYTITILLWVITMGHLSYKYKSGQIKSYIDLFKI
jgi:hypothetical protein